MIQTLGNLKGTNKVLGMDYQQMGIFIEFLEIANDQQLEAMKKRIVIEMQKRDK